MISEFDNEYRISQLIAKALAGSISEEEKEELDRWRFTSGSQGAEEELYRLISDPQNKSKRDEELNGLDLPAVWRSVEGKIIKKPHRMLRLRRIIAASAAAVVLIGSLLVYRLTDERVVDSPVLATVDTGSSKAYLITPDGGHISLVRPDREEFMLRVDDSYVLTTATKADFYVTRDSLQGKATAQTLRVPRGGEYELVLPDRTHVWLNSDSEIRFPSVFEGEKREIYLKGEAYFDVHPDKDSPFIIHTSNELDIEVLGTSFNVQAYPEEKLITTTLASGSVRISDGKKEITLSPDQQAIYDTSDGSLDSRKVNARQFSAWREGLFIFENQPLESILRTLARWYDIKVDVQEHLLDDYHFTGDLERYADFRKTLRMIESTTPGIHFIIENRSVMIEKTKH